jgi:hypothetical protein
VVGFGWSSLMKIYAVLRFNRSRILLPRTAIEKAIEAFKITDPYTKAGLIAQLDR